VKGDMSEFTEQIPHEVTIGLDAFNKRELKILRMPGAKHLGIQGNFTEHYYI